MKSLQEHLNESLAEARKVDYYNLGFDENGDEVMTILDDRGNYLEFEEKWLEGLIKKNKGYDNENFIKAVFDEMPEADQICREYTRNNDENEPSQYVSRDEMDKGWQDW